MEQVIQALMQQAKEEHDVVNYKFDPLTGVEAIQIENAILVMGWDRSKRL